MSEISTKYITKNKYPTLYVENFAKIERAEVELAPFTLFVGDNNSGKSYLTNLVWGLICECRQTSFISKLLDTQENKYNKCPSYLFIKQYIDDFYNEFNNSSNDKLEKTVPNELFINIIELINLLLNDYKEDLVRDIFNINDNSITIEKLELYFPDRAFISSFEKAFGILDDNEDGEKKSFLFKIIYPTNGSAIGLIFRDYDCKRTILSLINIICEFILKNYFQFGLLGDREKENILFLPSSRTGFTLLKSDLNAQMVDSFLDDKIDKLVLGFDINKPTKEFLRLYFKLKPTEISENEIIKLIEREIICGNVYLEDIGLNGIKYKPNNSEYSYAPKNTSAVVTELAPLVLFLRHVKNWNTLFMEEAEISLHPKLQRQIARVLIQLVNSNKRVFITTHSDTIIQHINNMIRLFNNPSERQKELLNKLNYTEQDMIDENTIRMYQFDTTINNGIEQKTSVVPLPYSNDGFDIPTFTDFLYDISDEVDELLKEMLE